MFEPADFPPECSDPYQIAGIPDSQTDSQTSVATTSVLMDIGCALSTRPHAPSFQSEPVASVRIEGSTVLFEAEEGLAVASNGTVAIDLRTGSIQPEQDEAMVGESTALLCHEAFDLDGTSASSAHWSQNGCGAVDLLVSAASEPEDLPRIAQIARAQEIGPESNWGGEHPEGEAGSLLMNELGTPEETIHDGNWEHGDTAYLGFRMRDESGQILYGWAEVAIATDGITLRRFAYDRSGSAIRAGAAAA